LWEIATFTEIMALCDQITQFFNTGFNEFRVRFLGGFPRFL